MSIGVDGNMYRMERSENGKITLYPFKIVSTQLGDSLVTQPGIRGEIAQLYADAQWGCEASSLEDEDFTFADSVLELLRKEGQL